MSKLLPGLPVLFILVGLACRLHLACDNSRKEHPNNDARSGGRYGDFDCVHREPSHGGHYGTTDVARLVWRMK